MQLLLLLATLLVATVCCLLLLLATLLVATACCLLLPLAALLVATVYCLLYVCEYGVLLLAIHNSRATCCRLLLALSIPNEI